MKGTINMADSKINELINHGKQNGKLTTKEITDVLEAVSYTHLTLPTKLEV